MTPADELRLAASTLRHPAFGGLQPRPVRLAIAAWLDATADDSLLLLYRSGEALAAARAINGDQT